MTLAQTIKKLKRADTLIVTPKIEAFLREHPEGAIWDDDGYALFREIVEAGKGNDQESRAGRFGASSRGTCLRRQIFTFIGMPGVRLLDPEIQNLFNDGKWRHIRWQMMLMQSGAVTHVEYPATLPKYRVKVSMDGLHADDQWIFELKGDRNYSRLMDGTPDAHLLQIHTMLLATGWDRAVYVMEDKASQQWREVIVKRDPVLIREVRKELEVLNDHVEERRLPDILPSCAQGEGPYKTCQFGPECRKRALGPDYWPVERDWDS